MSDGEGFRDARHGVNDWLELRYLLPLPEVYCCMDRIGVRVFAAKSSTEVVSRGSNPENVRWPTEGRDCFHDVDGDHDISFPEVRYVCYSFRGMFK